MCSSVNCQQRFTHANRHCPDHPYDQLKRCDDFVIPSISEQNTDIIKWLEKYRMEKEDRTPTRKTPKRSKQLPIDDGNNENLSSTEYSTSFLGMSPSTPSNPYKSRKGLMVELDMNAGLEASPIAPKTKAIPKIIQWNEPQSQEEDSGDEFEVPAQSTFNPKKKWLREAWQDDLARPLEQMPSSFALPPPSSTVLHDYNEHNLLQSSEPPPATCNINTQIVQSSHHSNRYVNPNEMRPTVLMVASKDRTMPLKTTDHEHNSSNIICEVYGSINNKIDSSYNQQHSINESSRTCDFTNGSNNTTSVNHDYSNKNTTYKTTSVINGYTNVTDSPSTGNRSKWLGALALMQLATENDKIQDDHHQQEEINSISTISQATAAEKSTAAVIRTIQAPMVSNSDSFIKNNIYSNVAQSYTQL